VKLARVAGIVIAVLGLIYAVMGGEYSMYDWWRVDGARDRELAEIERLEQEVDSLTRVLELLRGDAAMQERIARERFGMIRDGELLYKLVPSN
jgi:cell division protein FtsB